MVRRRQLLTVVSAAVAVAVSTSVAGVALNAATGGAVPWFPTMDRHYLRWLAGSTLLAAASALLMWWAQRSYEHSLLQVIPAEQSPEPWMVDRPAELGRIMQALRRRRGTGTAGTTTVVHGAGGFGKTTLARFVRADKRVIRRFGGGVFWVTLGRDARRGALVGKVNDLVRQIDPDRAQPFTDVRQAADHLAAVLADGPRRLVILDDVWFNDQLAAFPAAGRSARLVTTRVQSLAAGQAVPVEVDQMSDEQAARVLTADLTLPPPAGIVDALIVECGRWPLLLRLVNKIVLDQSRSRTDISGIAGELLDLLRRFGVGQLDILTGAAKQTPDVNDPDQRDKAVAMTIEASLGLLASDEQARFANLAVFAEDEDIPVPLVTLLWQQTDPQDAAAGRALCARLADLALLTQTATDDGGTIGLHDVVRDYLRRQLGKEKLTDLHRDLLDAAVGTLPDDFRSDGFGEAGTTWWLLPDSARYLREHLVEHLLAAGRRTEAEALVTDLRWIQCRLVEAGPVGPDADLLLIDSRSAARLRRLWEQIAHLLTRTEPEHSLVDILYSRVDHDAVWGPQARRLAKGRTLPALTNLDPLPDLPHPALRRTLTGPPKAVTALAIAPDSSWLASASVSGQVRVWDSITGKQRLELIVGADGVTALAISADGSRLASAGFDGWVRAWDSNTGRPCLKVHGHKAERPQ